MYLSTQILFEIGFNGRVARKKSYVNKIDRSKRIAYAKVMMEKPFDYWKHVLWSDESKFNLFGSDGKTIVWRSTTEAFNPKCTLPTIKHNGGSLMVWSCFSHNGVGNLCFIENIMEQLCYCEILQKNLLQSSKKVGLEKTLVFQYDNDSEHSARITKNWFKQKKLKH